MPAGSRRGTMAAPGMACTRSRSRSNRALYMDEATYERKPYFATLADHVSALIDALTRFDWRALKADGTGA